MHKYFITGLIILGFIFHAAEDVSYSETVIKFSHVVAPDTPKGQAVEMFARIVNQKLKGRVRVEVYPNSKLYRDREEIEALQINAVQMLAPSFAKFTEWVPEYQLLDFPYLANSYRQMHAILDGYVGQALFKKLESQGIKGLAYWDNGFKSISTNKKLIKAPRDMSGMRMRIQASKALDAQFKLAGAIPVPMAFSEVYKALQQGVVDGTENPISNLYTQRMHEVQKYLTISDHGYLGYAVIANRKFWDGLSPDIRKVLEDVLKEVTKWEREISDDLNKRDLESVKKYGKTQIYYLTQKEKDEWKRFFIPVHKQLENIVTKELLNAAYKAAAGVKR